MAFKAPPPLLQKVLGFKAFKHSDGKFYLFDVPGILSPVYIKAYETKLFINSFGEKKAQDFLYTCGYQQGVSGVRMTSERFGYAETIRDKGELLKFTLAQSDLIGLGHFEWKKLDFANEIFILSGKSSLAEEYKNFFGVQDTHIDFFFRGEIAALVESVIKKPVLAIEKECYAMNSKECIFIIRPIERWETNDKDYISQKVDMLPDFKRLNSKKDPYIIS